MCLEFIGMNIQTNVEQINKFYMNRLDSNEKSALIPTGNNNT